MANKIIYDKNLWFEHEGCVGKHFLFGNPHTFPGRMWAWCPKKETSFCVSKSEIGEMSVQTSYWIKGFLIGNQPAPPTDENDNEDLEGKSYKDWLKQIDKFVKTGLWK